MAAAGDSQKKSRAAGKDLRKSQIPKEVGVLTHDGVTTGGKLAYRWQDVRVEATPTRLRAKLDEGASTTRRQRAREATPDRALRKMTEKVSP